MNHVDKITRHNRVAAGGKKFPLWHSCSTVWSQVSRSFTWTGAGVLPGEKTHTHSQDDIFARWRITAIVCGFIACFLAMIFPLLPVKMHNISYGWPNAGVVETLNAPLATLIPQEITASLPCAAAEDVSSDNGIIFATIPSSTPTSAKIGLFVRRVGKNISVTDRGVELASIDYATAIHAHCTIGIVSNYTHTLVQFSPYPQDATFEVKDPVLRPQVVGLYTDTTVHRNELRAHVVVDSRWESSPTVIKKIVALLGIMCMIVALYAVKKLDSQDGRRSRRFPIGSFHIHSTDIFVVLVLVLWVFLGPNTSDDGYIFTMARLSDSASYMVNFFRWWGASEDPFGWHYNIFRILARINPAAWFMRLPECILGIGCWILLSREVLPRLGRTVRSLNVAYWSAAMALLVIWLPLNNGLRPEPEVTVSALIVWCLLERCIASAKVFPLALAVMLAAFTCGEAPGGTLTCAILLVCSSAVITRLRLRWYRDGILPLLLPIAAAGMSFLFVAFADQPLGVVLDGVRAKTMAGPSLDWWDEPIRFYYLIRFPDVDGAQNRRIGVLVTVLCMIAVAVVLARKRHPSAIALGPAWRLLGIMLGIMIVMMLTPTKWVHHFGVYAAFTAALAGLAGALIYPAVATHSAKRWYFLAAVLFVWAISFGGSNGWWFVASYGIPWHSAPPTLGGISISSLLLLLSMIIAMIGLIIHMHMVIFPREHSRDSSSKVTLSSTSSKSSSSSTDIASSHGWARIISPLNKSWLTLLAAPLAVVLFLNVMFNISSFAYAAWKERQGFSWWRSNIADLKGQHCALADKILIEANVEEGFLQPITSLSGSGIVPGSSPLWDDSPQSQPALLALLGNNAHNFSSQLPNDLRGEQVPVEEQVSSTLEDTSSTSPISVSGSNRELPYGLPHNTPIASTYGKEGTASLNSQWYILPPRTDRTPLITITAAGAINGTTDHGEITNGGTIALEFAHGTTTGKITYLSTLTPIDPGPVMKWRNLRYPTDRIPSQANLVRISATLVGSSPAHWMAFTPPRLSTMVTAQEFLGNRPGLVDWLPALAFPCQQEIQVHNGLTQLPSYRIEPDYNAIKNTTNSWQSGRYGGPLGNFDAMMQAVSIPSYLVNNWALDWGNIQLYIPLRPGKEPDLTITPITRSGAWRPDPTRSELF